MKNSNKLLILLIVLVFSIPLIMVMGFKTAIKENRYVVKNRFGMEEAFKSLKPFKAVKLNSNIKNPLLCNIKSGNKPEYKFVNYNTKENGKKMPDNCSIDVIGDTLFISYDGKKADLYLLEMDLMVPDGVSVIAEGARVTVNTIQGCPKNLSLDLSKAAELYITNNDRIRTTIIGSESNPEAEKTEVSNYSIKSSGSVISITAPIKISNLKINADSSQISIGNDVMIDSLSGRLSPETIINAPYKFVKNLQ